MNHHKQRSLLMTIKDIVLALHVMLFAWGMYLFFAAIWLVLLLVLYWLMVHPMVIAGLGMVYFVLFAPTFYPILTDEPPFNNSNDSPRIML